MSVERNWVSQTVILRKKERNIDKENDLTRGRSDDFYWILAAMPAGSVLINCAGGTLVDSEALCDALDTDHLWGAGFDVFPEEPIPANSRLLRSPHIVMTPHIAGASKQTAEKAARIAAGEVRRFLQDEPLEHCVKPANERVDPYCVRVAGL